MKNLAKFLIVMLTLLFSWMIGVHLQYWMVTAMYLIITFIILAGTYNDEEYNNSVLTCLNILVYLAAIFTFGQFSWTSFIGG